VTLPGRGRRGRGGRNRKKGGTKGGKKSKKGGVETAFWKRGEKKKKTFVQKRGSPSPGEKGVGQSSQALQFVGLGLKRLVKKK